MFGCRFASFVPSKLLRMLQHDGSSAKIVSLLHLNSLLSAMSCDFFSAGGDAKSQHRRAIVNLQATLVEHEEQLKDMERRTVAVSPEFSH